MMVTVAVAMSEPVARSMTSLYGLTMNGREVADSMLAGSGCFIRFNNSTYGLTAGHVLAERHAHGEVLVHSVGNGEPPEVIVHPIFESQRGADLSCFKIADKAVPRLLGCVATEALVGYELIADEVLFLQGFSGVKSHGLSDGHYSEALPYASREGRSTYEWFDPALHIAVRYSAEGATDAKARRAWLPTAHGFSGCLLWNTNRMAKGAEWTPADARVIGVVTTWDQDGQSLIAIRSHVVCTFLANVEALSASLRINQRGPVRAHTWPSHEEIAVAAYYRWLQRGGASAPEDAVADWLAARQDLVARSPEDAALEV